MSGVGGGGAIVPQGITWKDSTLSLTYAPWKGRPREKPYSLSAHHLPSASPGLPAAGWMWHVLGYWTSRGDSRLRDFPGRISTCHVTNSNCQLNTVGRKTSRLLLAHDSPSHMLLSVEPKPGHFLKGYTSVHAEGPRCARGWA